MLVVSLEKRTLNKQRCKTNLEMWDSVNVCAYKTAIPHPIYMYHVVSYTLATYTREAQYIRYYFLDIRDKFRISILALYLRYTL